VSFFGSIFGGSNSSLNSLIPKYGAIGSNQTNTGSSYENTAGSFWSDILSGNSSKINQALAPEISADKVATQQDQKTRAMTGGRSGGTAAANASSADKVHSDITNLIGSLTNSSANSLASLGTNMVSTGLSSYGMQQQASQEQMENWKNSLLGKGITTAASFAESYGLSKIPGMNNNQNNSSPSSSSYQPVYDNDGNQIA